MLKRTILLSVFFVAVIGLSAQNEDKESIKQVIQKAYVDGLQNLKDLNETEKGFHPGFNLLIKSKNMLKKYPIYNWIYSSELRKANKKEDRPVTTCAFPFIDITGDAAVAKIELMREGKKIFTDYLSLYKFDEGWRIVSKIYHHHEEK